MKKPFSSISTMDEELLTTHSVHFERNSPPNSNRVPAEQVVETFDFKAMSNYMTCCCGCWRYLYSLDPSIGLWLSACLLFFLALLLHHSGEDELNIRAFAYALPFSIISFFIMVCTNRWILENYDMIDLKNCWMVYFVTVISFALIELTMYIRFPKSFDIPVDLVDRSNGIVWTDLVSIFFYYSMSVQTLTGYGDIYAAELLSAIVSVCQMLFGTAYGVVMIALALPQTGEASIYERLRRPSQEPVAPLSWWKRFKNHPKLRRIRVWLRSHLLVIILISQVIKYLVLVLFKKEDQSWFDPETTVSNTVVIVCFLVGVLEALLLFFTSLKIASKPQEVRPWFLVQAYVGTIFLFGGIFLTLQLIRPADKAWKLNNTRTEREPASFYLWSFTYHSFTTMTNSGINGALSPCIWYTCLACSVQMLVGVFFHVVIFGICVNVIINKLGELKQSQREIKGLKKINAEIGSNV